MLYSYRFEYTGQSFECDHKNRTPLSEWMMHDEKPPVVIADRKSVEL